MSDKNQENVEPEVQGTAEVAEGEDASLKSVAPDANTDELTREAELEAQVAELKDQLLRAVAEQENVRKRADREREQLRKFGISNFAKDLLSAADNMRRALDAGPSDLDGVEDSVRNLIVGVEMTERELLTAFEKNGVRKIDPMGEKFDYNFHQAMFEVEDSNQEAGTIVQVLQAGYAIDDRILRPAMVGVAKGPAADVPDHLDTTV
ncbi:MAG: nucleotide exchange factor GrpE [Alphaproteobacteria bacterium]|jgi:molecular chaperone GrpE|nr:nucleotide exchange factor GrpE [Alphaproteobacteria bacterium]